MGQEEYSELAAFLRRFIRRFRAVKGLEGICLFGIALVLLFSLGLAVKEIKYFFPYAPAIYAALAAAVVIAPLGWTLFQLWRRVSDEWAALYIEKKCPHLKNNLINSLQLYPEIARPERPAEISASMVLALLRATRKQLHALKAEELVSTAPAIAKGRLLAILFVPVLAVVLFNPSSVSDTFSLLAHPLKDIPPSETRIDLSPKGMRVARGTPVTLQAVATGAVPKSMDLLVLRDGAAEERLTMEATGGGRFTAALNDVKSSFAYRAVAGSFSSPSYRLEAVDPPEIGNLRATLYPPHYTGLPAENSSGGNLEGLRGSTARLEAETSKEVVKAKLMLDQGREVPLKIDGKKLQGNLVLFQSGRYQIEVEDALGFRNKPIAYDVRIRPDGFPTVEILRPAEDLEVNGDETLPIEFTARDDFGIQDAALIVKVGERQEKIPIKLDGVKKLITRERFDLDLGKLGLNEGNEAIYNIEVHDNDTISGPKIGVSRGLRLTLKNLRGEHKQLADNIRDLSGRMVDLLAQHLERPADKTGADKDFEKKLGDAAKSVEEIMQRSEKDRLTDFATWSDLEALKRNLEFTKNDLLKREEQAAGEEKEKARDDISTEMERMSLLAEDIGKRLKAEEVANSARDLMKGQERLMDALEKLRSGDKNLDAVLKQLSQMANLLNSLQQQLSQMATQLPEDFVNSEALQGLNFGDMQRMMEEIRKKLAQGDIEGAMQLARELFNQMASMVAALQGAQQSAMSSSMGRMQGEMMRSANELQQLAREQQELLVDTEAANRRALTEREKQLKEKLDRFMAKANRELGRLAEMFPDVEGGGPPRENALDDATVNNLVKEMIGRLLKKDFSGFDEIMGMAEKELGKTRSRQQEAKASQAQASLKDLKNELDSLLGIPPTALSDTEKGGIRDLGRRQGTLKERTDQLHEKLESLFQLFPSLDPQITKNIKEAGGSMGQAQGRLGELDSKNAVPPERRALEQLSQSQQQMQNAMQQLAQRGQLGRMAVSRLFRMGRMLPSGELVPLPGMPQFPQFDADGGMTGLDTEKFRLPGKEDYRAPRSFREEILESLKQGVPRQMKEQIESYFKNLSE
jgi:Domain of unknown function (DUF4175)